MPPAEGGMCLVPEGVDTARMRRAPNRCDPDRFTVGFIGALEPSHRVADLVGAVAVLHRVDPTYRLLVVGEGPERQRLASQVSEAGLDGVVEMTAGRVAPAEVAELLDRMDVGVALYPDQEVVHYLAAGLPVVATDVGGLARRLDRVGLVVRPGQPMALAAAIAVLRNDPGWRADLGTTARHLRDLAEVTDGAPRAASPA